MAKSSKITYKKLGRHNANGLAYLDEKRIEVDERLKSRKLLEILIHEKLHLLNPEWSESKICYQSKSICSMLWQQKFRRIDI